MGGLDIDPISKKEWGFVLLLLTSIGSGLKGRDKGSDP